MSAARRASSLPTRASARAARTAKPARPLGSLDLVLVVLVVAAAWLRTPVGGLADRLVDAVRGTDRDLPALTSFFVTGAPPEVVVLAEKAGLLPATPAPADGFPEPWRTAARLNLDGPLPPPAEALAEAHPDVPKDERAIATLDLVYADHPDPEAALEVWAVGAELRDRAIGRAKAAGEADPESFASHRAYLPDDAARRADRFVAGTLALGTVLEFRWPLAVPHRLTSPYGERMHPVLKKLKFHDGVDLAVPEGSPVLSAQAGTVAVVGHDGVSGNYVVLDHGHGVKTSYCHLSATSVAKGDVVLPGQVIGASGNTGRSTGPHLHFTVRIGRSTVDPMKLKPPSGLVADTDGASEG